MAADLPQIGIEDAAEIAPIVPGIGVVGDIVKGPNLHAGDAFTQQVLRQRAGVGHKTDEILVSPRLVNRRDIAAAAQGGATIVWPATGVVGFDTVARRPTQQLPDRLSGRLAEDVP